MSRKKVLSDEELVDLSRAINASEELLRAECPHEGDSEMRQFAFIGRMLEGVRCSAGFGIDVTLVGRDSAKNLPGPYTAMGYTPQGVPCIDTIITNRGPAAAVAVAIIATSREGP